MQVVILAGGLGTRLRRVASDTPKALVPVAGKPFIEHQFALLRQNGLTDVLLCIGYRGERIEQHLGDGSRFGMRAQYSREDPGRLLGTGGALVQALGQLEETFFVMYGDSYLPIDYRQMIRWFEAHSWPAVMSVYHNREQWDKSNTRIEGDRVTFYRKTAAHGEADYIDYGLSIFRRSVVTRYAGSPMPLDLAVIQSELVQRGELGAYVVTKRFYEIGKPEGLAELDRLLRQSKSP